MGNYLEKIKPFSTVFFIYLYTYKHDDNYLFNNIVSSTTMTKECVTRIWGAAKRGWTFYIRSFGLSPILYCLLEAYVSSQNIVNYVFSLLLIFVVSSHQIINLIQKQRIYSLFLYWHNSYLVLHHDLLVQVWLRKSLRYQ